MRDKLIELIIDGFHNCTKPHEVYAQLDLEALADYLISHGVTVREWIPVSERLPEETKDEYVLVVCDYHGKIEVETRKMWNIDGPVTHWMPLPEAPKEVE